MFRYSLWYWLMQVVSGSTVLSTISRKDVFRLAFYFKWKYFVLIVHILSETICRFCFCVLCSNIYPKIKFTANGSDLCNFYSKGIFFFKFCLRTYFLTFLCWFWIIDASQKYRENFRTIDQAELLLKICLQVTYPTDFCIIWIHFNNGKKRKYLIFLKPMSWIKFSA